VSKPAPGPYWAVSPTKWGAVKNYDVWNDKWVVKDSVALHHGGGSDYPAHNVPYAMAKEEQQLRMWEKYHLSKGWRGIAYGWALGQSGAVYRLRGWNLYGAHLGDWDDDNIPNNSEVIPVVFVGSGSRVSLSPAADASFKRLRAYFNETLEASLVLRGHKEIQPKPTVCPGSHLMTYVKNNRELEVDDDLAILTDEEQVELHNFLGYIAQMNSNVSFVKQAIEDIREKNSAGGAYMPANASVPVVDQEARDALDRIKATI